MPSTGFFVACFAATITAVSAGVVIPDINNGVFSERQHTFTNPDDILLWPAPTFSTSFPSCSGCVDTRQALHQVNSDEAQALIKPQQTVQMPTRPATLLENRATNTITVKIYPGDNPIDRFFDLNAPPEEVNSAWNSATESIKKEQSELCDSRIAGAAFQDLVTAISSAKSAMQSAESTISDMQIKEMNESSVSASAESAYESAVKEFKKVSGLDSASSPSIHPSLWRTISSVMAIVLVSVAVVL